MPRSPAIDAGLDKLQHLLLDLTEGDEVRVPHAAAVSGLQAAQCEAVFDALTRAGLMVHLHGDAYVRRHLDEAVAAQALATADSERPTSR